jgi:hypothetical protein
MTWSLCGTALMSRFCASLSVSSVCQEIVEPFARVSGIAVWTYFAHVACVSSRTHLTFNERHLSQDTVLDWLFLGAILEIHLAGRDKRVSTQRLRFLVKATTYV